jgi:hypothetical protein
MKILRSFRATRVVALALGAVLCAGMLTSSPATGGTAAQELDVRKVADLPPPLPTDIKVMLRVDGITKIAKLGSAMRFGPGLFKGLIHKGEEPEDPADDTFIYPIEGEMTMPKATGYFVAFKFMPVINNVNFVQVGKAEGTVDMHDLSAVQTDVTMNLNLVVSSVYQNGDSKTGVELKVGANCHTQTPVVIHIKGPLDLNKKRVPPKDPIQLEPEPGKPSQTAAIVNTTYTIPPFTGCGVTENLSPLITGLVSGPDNQLRIYLSGICYLGCADFWDTLKVDP